jgi:hypothetical protein
MHSRSKTRFRSLDIVRGIIAAILVPVGLCHSLEAWAIEPRPIPLQAAPPEDKSSEQVIQGGVAATMLFATLGLGSGVIAAGLDAASQRRRDDPCRSCPGGFNDLQRDMATIANVSLISFFTAGFVGAATTVYAATTTQNERTEARRKMPDVQLRASRSGIVVTF